MTAIQAALNKLYAQMDNNIQIAEWTEDLIRDPATYELEAEDELMAEFGKAVADLLQAMRISRI